MFFSMLVMYSAFVLTSVHTEYYIHDIAKFFEYYVYFWGAGDCIEELISCFVRILCKISFYSEGNANVHISYGIIKIYWFAHNLLYLTYIAQNVSIKW